MGFACYLLSGPRKPGHIGGGGRETAYVGATQNPARRLRQHNREIKGGAKYTARYRGRAFFVVVIYGFPDWVSALQFEWCWKHKKPRRYGPKNKARRLCELLADPRWTRAAKPTASQGPFVVHWLTKPSDLDLDPSLFSTAAAVTHRVGPLKKLVADFARV